MKIHLSGLSISLVSLGLLFLPQIALADFAPAASYAVNGSASLMFAADLDGNGKNDIITANCSSDDLSILMNTGNGTFAPAVSYPTGDCSRSVHAADFDGDGDKDLATANYSSSTISILFNTGNGTFGAPTTYTAGLNTYSISADDFDGDGDNDVVVTNYTSDSVSVLFNNGSGIFSAAVNYPVGDGPRFIQAVDLDGDNDSDLAVANFNSDNVSILFNAGDGTFGAAVNTATGDGANGLFAADLDGDSDRDLAVVNFFTDSISVLLNAGNGSFGAPVSTMVGDGPNVIYASDLDGDGDNDLAIAESNSDTVSVLYNVGNSTFGTRTSYATGDFPGAIVASNLDEDGDTDIAVANNLSRTVSVYINITQSLTSTNIQPLINIRTVPSPLVLPNGPGSVTYDYTVSNPGQVTLSNITLVDDKCSNVIFISGDSNSNDLLETNELWLYRCTTILSQTTVNFATARGVANDMASVDTAIVEVVVGVPVVPPLIHIVKTPDPFILPAGGGSVIFSYIVTNPGTVNLTGVTVTDAKCTNVMLMSGDANGDSILQPTETWRYTCTTNVTQTTTDTAIVTGDANGLTAVDTALASVLVIGSPFPPLIHIFKKADPVVLPVSGGLVNYTFTVTNPGTVTLGNVSVTDDKCGIANLISGDANGNGLLETTETWTYTCQQNLTETTTNVATASGSANSLTVTDITVASVVLSPTLLPPDGVTRRLIKLACAKGSTANDPCRAVYYVGRDGNRHAFPNSKVYFSWYASFDAVTTVSSAELASYVLGKNVTYRPGVRLVKFSTSNNVYAVERNGVLRWVKSEEIAHALYGDYWNTRIDDISDVFYSDYSFGSDIDYAIQYNIEGQLLSNRTID